MTRGRLRIYLGAAPGVGKTHSMLTEGLRRAERGGDVVIGCVDDVGRPSIEQLANGLPRMRGSSSGIDCTELDVDAVMHRRPQVVLVDELAHRTADHHGRWEDVEVLLRCGIDVITTINIGNLASMAEVVTGITGAPPTETVPDAVVCAADQIELVDISPEALRRRLAHGHIYPPERVDAAMANLFRPEVLGALRQLSLLWTADRVDEQLERQLLPDAPRDSAAVRERIVVALDGHGGDLLVRRAEKVAGKAGARLVGVHVVSPRRQPGPALEQQRRLLTGLGGLYREVIGDNVADALVEFARVEQATQLVVGTTPGANHRAVAAQLIERIGATDVHVVGTTASVASPSRISGLRSAPPLRPRSRVAAWSLCLLVLPLMTAVLSAERKHVSVGSALMLDLCVVFAVAAFGGWRPGLVASLLAFGLTNWYLTPPLHTLTVSDAENVVAFAVFVLVTMVVSVSVDRAARRSRDATSARAEAAALARSAATLVGSDDPLPELLEQVRATFGLGSATVLERTEHGWWPTHTSGHPELLSPDDGTSIDISAGTDLRLLVSDDVLRPEQLEVLRAFGDQLTMAVEARRLRTDAANAGLLAETNALRSALLQAVSHDFRTPLATIKASASGLLQREIEFSADDREQLLKDIDGAADRLDRMVRNLLDMSRLQAGAVELSLRAVALEEVVAAALGGIANADKRVTVDVSETIPMVSADAALLERAIANLVSNAVAWSPADHLVRVEAGRIRDTVDLRIVDCGPGVAAADRQRVFEPFQRLGDRSTEAGVGLGMAIAKGFVEAMGAQLGLDDTPGGGLTVSIRLHVADEDLQ